MIEAFSDKQLEFITNSGARWNLAHGSVRSGKTVCTIWKFLSLIDTCPDDKIYIVGHTFDSAHRNVIRLILSSPEMAVFRPFCTWSGKKLYFKDKAITVLGAKDEGAVGSFQGDTYSLVYCDEMTLYPQSIIEMIDSRLSKEYSQGYAAMNPTYPSHILKKWIDMADAGDNNYYALHFTVEDNPYLPTEYIKILRENTSGLFYKRNYLGLWCLAEGAIFDFFDKSVHVVSKPPRAAEYWIAGIDYGVSNAFSCLLIGVSTGQYTQSGKCMWVEREYFWDSKKTGRQKLNSEFANDVQELLEPYGVKQVYIDPSAASFKLEMARRGMHCVDANNDVTEGIRMMTNEMKQGNLFVCRECVNLIREIESYVWDEKKAKEGEDAPLKKADHAVDALRYCIATHKVATWQPKPQGPDDYLRDRFIPTRR
jgi:PBSX family phage terminase large subunit